MQNQDMSLVLSSDAKPRLKWTPELHQRFADAVNQLGGAEKATPKSLMRVMGIHGLTLYHLKSHLQKYRLGKSQPSETCFDHDHDQNQDQEEFVESRRNHPSRDYSDGIKTQINESLQISQALQMQMEVQRKLHEQIEVQRHLQLRIEAQGKYLQSVLKKAQDTLSGYNSSSAEIELAKAELSQLVSMVDTECPSSLSVLTDIGGSSLNDIENKPLRGTRCSLESSLTSSDSSGRKEDLQLEHETNPNTNKWNSNSVVLPLMEMHSEEKCGPIDQVNARKRRSITCDGNCVEQPSWKRSTVQKSAEKSRKLDLLETFDLNRHYFNDLDSAPKGLDLNCKEVEKVHEHV